MMMSSGSKYQVEKVGYFTPKPVDCDEIGPGEIGFIVTGIKDLSDLRLEIQLLTQSSQQINRYLDSSLANLLYSVVCFQ